MAKPYSHPQYHRPGDLSNEFLGTMALTSAPMPIIGDIAGLAADVNMYRTQPETRNWKNYALTGLGAVLPLVPAAYLLQGGKKALAAKLPRQAGVLGGVRARNASMGALQRAAQDTADVETVWQRHGWYRGEDGKWRFEIPDRDATVNMEAAREAADIGYKPGLSKILSHPEFYENYPKAASWPVSVDARVRGGEFNPKNNQITINPGFLENPENFRKILLHEVQHGVQEAEGFTRGGSPTFTDRMKYLNELQTYRTLDAALLEDKMRTIDKLNTKLNQYPEFETNEFRSLPDWRQDEARKIEEQLTNLESDVRARWDDLVSNRNVKVQSDRILSASDEEYYNKLLGEVEARNVEARATADPETLKMFSPYYTQPEKDVFSWPDVE